VLVTGFYQTDTNFGPSASEALPDALGTNVNGFAAKLGPNREHLWSVPMVGTMAAGYDIVADADDNAYVVGSCAGTVVIGDKQVPCNATSDVLVLKLDADGALAWANNYGARATMWRSALRSCRGAALRSRATCRAP